MVFAREARKEECTARLLAIHAEGAWTECGAAEGAEVDFGGVDRSEIHPHCKRAVGYDVTRKVLGRSAGRAPSMGQAWDDPGERSAEDVWEDLMVGRDIAKGSLGCPCTLRHLAWEVTRDWIRPGGSKSRGPRGQEKQITPHPRQQIRACEALAHTVLGGVEGKSNQKDTTQTREGHAREGGDGRMPRRAGRAAGHERHCDGRLFVKGAGGRRLLVGLRTGQVVITSYSGGTGTGARTLCWNLSRTT